MAEATGLNKEKYYHGLLPREDIKVIINLTHLNYRSECANQTQSERDSNLNES